MTRKLATLLRNFGFTRYNLGGNLMGWRKVTEGGEFIVTHDVARNSAPSNWLDVVTLSKWNEDEESVVFKGRAISLYPYLISISLDSISTTA